MDVKSRYIVVTKISDIDGLKRCEADEGELNIMTNQIVWFQMGSPDRSKSVEEGTTMRLATGEVLVVKESDDEIRDQLQEYWALKK